MSYTKDQKSIMKFWGTKMKDNWMCNRALSPPPIPFAESDKPSTSKESTAVQDIPFDNTMLNDGMKRMTNSSRNELPSPSIPIESPLSSLSSEIECNEYSDPDFILSDGNCSSEFYSDDDYVEDLTKENQKTLTFEKITEQKQYPTEEIPMDEVEKVSRKNYKDKLDFCVFCEKDVSHFARHLITWHEKEFEVQKIMAQKPNSLKRRELLSVLRKKGNFILNRTRTTIRPVKRVEHSESSKSECFLPCKHCFGYYKRKCLARHMKVCISNNNRNDVKRQSAQSDGQTTLLMNSLYKHDELLKKEVFPRMRADEISAIAKRDPLICFYGYSYLKGRKSKGNLDLVRQNMRNLGKLLKLCKDENSEVKDLIDLLKPSLFELIVKSVNIMARYNSETERYESPTLAMNFGTLIKKCCDLAYITLIKQKQDTSAQVQEFNTLKVLINSQWADEVSAQAASNLNENKWNKEELLPLTSDLKKLNTYLLSMCNESYLSLNTCKNNQWAYNTLKEVLYAQIILLNRRRPAEVAQLKVHTFKAIDFDQREEEDNELQNCLTETEKILMRTFTRIVIRGKRGRGVPILLSPTMKTQFDLILETRINFVTDNEYIFHTNGAGFIDGTKIMHKYASKCGIQNSKTITATKLRKHLATITQLLQFSNNDMEQLAKFMGHTLKTHCSVYRMSDSMYQTAKVSKLLLLMTKGGVEEFKGKNLEQIDIDLNPIYDDNDVVEELTLKSTQVKEQEISEAVASTSHQTLRISSDKISKMRKNTHKQSWKENEKQLLAKYFKDNIETKKPPKRQDIERIITLYPDIFEGRKWTSIKAMVYNMYTGKLKFKK